MKSIIVMIVFVTLMFIASSSAGGEVVLAGFLAPLALPFMAISTAFSGYSAYAQGRASKQQAENAASIAEYNAQVSEQEAQQEAQRAAYEAAQFKKRGQAIMASQRVGYAKGGVMGGTPLTVLGETAKELELDRQMILYGGQIASQRRYSQAMGERLMGSSYLSQGRAAGRAGVLAAGGSVLSGLSNMAMFSAMKT